MPGVKGSTTVWVLCAGAFLAGCQTPPVQYAGNGAHVTYAAASATGVELYHGAGAAFRAPLHDLNMMQDQIPPVLLRAENKPYDLAGVNSCGDVLDRVSELDLALGPDVDTPKQRKRTRVSRGADFAASTALDAAGSAAEHFIPMRGTLKQLTGATRYEKHAQHAVLAGQTRRSFLKAVGMAHGCSWPAAPLDFKPPQVADISAPWTPPAASPVGGAIMLAATAAPAPGVRAFPTPAAVGAASVATSGVSRLAMVSAPVPRPALQLASSERLVIPAATQAADPRQAWRPTAMRRPEVVEVSAPVVSPAASSGTVSSAALTTSGGSTALAPWSPAFASSAGVGAARP